MSKVRATSPSSDPGAPSRARVLVVDDDPIAAESLAEFLREEGHDAAVVLSGGEAREALKAAEGVVAAGQAHAPAAAGPFGVVLCDVAMPGMNGLELLRHVTREHPQTAVIMLTGYGTIESAVSAVRAGAADYLTKPVVDAELRIALERALRQQALMVENAALKTRLDERFGLERIVGSHPRMQKVYELIEAVAPSRTTVLMNGESGTGKSLIAAAIHHLSPRRARPFIQLSCGSIPETLLESELFGHVKGAFTGAHADKIGRFLAADGGTIFLDEINSASPAMQLKLLRVLQERKFEPVGSTVTIEVDARVILASNRPLEGLVERGEFRQDLYYRINVIAIEVPPLRDRAADIPLLAAHFLGNHARDLKKSIVGFSREAMDALLRHDYPGNVRELENIIERAAVLTRSPTVGVESLPEHVVHGPAAGPQSPHRLSIARGLGRDGEADGGAWSPVALEDALREPEKRIILLALKANDWNRQKTADDLKINRTTLYKKMRSLGIDGGDERMAG